MKNVELMNFNLYIYLALLATQAQNTQKLKLKTLNFVCLFLNFENAKKRGISECMGESFVSSVNDIKNRDTLSKNTYGLGMSLP